MRNSSSEEEVKLENLLETKEHFFLVFDEPMEHTNDLFS